MLGDRYIVVRGDNLWKIAAKTLGGGKQWPRIWRYNNRPAVVRVTGRSIPNPDVIYEGQLLLIPRLPTERITSGEPNDASAMSHLAPATPATPTSASVSVSDQSRPPASPPHERSLSEHLQHVRSPLSFKYRLDMRWPPQNVGTAVLQVRMTGDLVLMTKKAYPATYATNRGELEHQVASEANHAFGKLVNDNRFIFDPAQKRLTYRSMLVSQSTTPNMPATAIGAEMSSNSPAPKLRAEIRIPKLEGSYGAFRYVALDNKLVVEITPNPQPPTAPPPSAVISDQRRPVAQPSAAANNPWGKVLGAGLVVSAGVLVFAAVVDEWIPVLGQADDVPAALAAGAMLARGLAMIGGTHANLPSTASPAHLDAKATVVGSGI